MINDSYDIAKAFQRIENRLISSLKYNLLKHFNEEKIEDMNWSSWQTEQLKSLELFKKRNKKLFKSEFNTINYDIRQFLTKNFEDSRLSQENLILESIENGKFSTQNKKINKLWNIYKTSRNKRIKKKQLTRIFKETSNLEASFFKIDEKKLKQLIKETTENMKRAENSILRYTEDQYRKIIFDAQVFANTGAGTVQQAVDMATKDFLSKGINCIQYANGAMVNIKSYAEMAVRTANSRAHLYGEGEKRSKWGVHTVLVPNRGGGCPYCIKFQGKIFIDDVYSRGTIKEANELNLPLLSSAIKQKLFHPNCKDTTVTYFPGVNTEVTPPTKEQLVVKEQNYIKEQKLNYIDRNIDKYSRLELGSTDAENVEKYHNKRLAWQEYKENFKENKEITFYDVEDYKRFKNATKSENLKTFENFLDMKYNNIENYNLMKEYTKLFEKEQLPNDMTYKIFENNLNDKNWQAVGFNPQLVERHKKHLSEFNNIVWEEYEERAKKLLNSKENENILGFITESGTRFKYDKVNNEFACARPNGITQTYFKPRDSIKYWEREVIRKYEPRKN